MKIGIDISQIAYEGTGVSWSLKKLVEHLLLIDKKNEYIFFFSSLRGKLPADFAISLASHSNVTIRQYKIPPTMLALLWNKLHILPIEYFIGNIDIFLASDWVQPPKKHARMATIIHDLVVYKFPEESHNVTEFSAKKLIISSNIVDSQKRKLTFSKKECDIFLCVSEATKKDAQEILGIAENKLKVIYWGI